MVKLHHHQHALYKSLSKAYDNYVSTSVWTEGTRYIGEENTAG